MLKQDFTVYINSLNTGIVFTGNILGYMTRFTTRYYNKRYQLIRDFCKAHNIELNAYTKIWLEDEAHNKYVFNHYCSYGKNNDHGYFFKHCA